jgi:hypothetical protein
VRRELGNSPAPAEKPTLFMIFDGMVPNIASVVDGIYLALANRVEYAGVNAGSETFQPMPCLFDGERVVGDGLLGLLLPAGMVPLLAHGFARPSVRWAPRRPRVTALRPWTGARRSRFIRKSSRHSSALN